MERQRGNVPAEVLGHETNLTIALAHGKRSPQEECRRWLDGCVPSQRQPCNREEKCALAAQRGSHGLCTRVRLYLSEDAIFGRVF